MRAEGFNCTSLILKKAIATLYEVYNHQSGRLPDGILGIVVTQYDVETLMKGNFSMIEQLASNLFKHT